MLLWTERQLCSFLVIQKFQFIHIAIVSFLTDSLVLQTDIRYTRAISERFRDKELIIKRYINSPSLLFTLH